MSTFRYVAVPLSGGDTAARERRAGEMSGRTAADVRASLRRIGFQVIEISPVATTRSADPPRSGRSTAGRTTSGPAVSSATTGRPARGESAAASPAGPAETSLAVQISAGWRNGWLRHLRTRRRVARADLADSLATMIDSGLPLLDAVGTLLDAEATTRSARRTLLVQLRDDLAGGRSVADAVALQPAWFDAGEIAMVAAGQRRGELAAVLRNLATRHERSEAVTQRLVGALVYPAIVLLAGVGVAVFLGTRTLPELARVLEGSDIAVPVATRAVMAIAGFATDHAGLLVAAAAISVAAIWTTRQVLRERGGSAPRWYRRLSPRPLRRAAIGGLCRRLAELIRTGVPVEEAMRVTAPTLASGHLRDRLIDAASRIERGEEISAALDDPDWFDAELRRLVDIGQASGELDSVLDRLGQRYGRQATRFVDRLVTLLEPLVIVLLAALVGTVVMAAILPFLRLQEILG